MPVVSVVMPVYRRPEYLPMAIESILNQTFGDFELICVDGRDGGEACRDIIQDYAVQDARVKYMIQGGVGVADARNTGLNHASGEYLATHDDDDVSNLQRLQKQLDFLKNNRDYAAVMSHTSIINEAGKIIRENLDGTRYPGRPEACYYRSAALTAGGYRRFFMLTEDHDFGLRFIEKGFVTGMIDEELYYRREHQLYNLMSDYAMCLKYSCVAYYCSYCRKILGQDPVYEGEDFEEILEKLGGIHLPIEDIFDESIVKIVFHDPIKCKQSFSRFLIGLCRNAAKKVMKSGSYSDFISIIRFLENYHGVDKMSKKYERKAKIQILWQALRYGRLGYFRDVKLIR